MALTLVWRASVMCNIQRRVLRVSTVEFSLADNRVESDDVRATVPTNLNIRELFPAWSQQRWDYAHSVVDLIVNYLQKLFPDTNGKLPKAIIPCGRFAERMDKNEVGGLTDELHEANVITKGGYWNGTCSRSYSIGEGYWGAVTTVPIIMSVPKRKLLKSRSFSAHVENESLTLRIYHQLRDDLQCLLIDESAAWNVVKSLPTKIKRFHNSVALVRLLSNQRRASVDRFGRRFHTNVTNLNSRLRDLLTVDGERLVGCDVRNCQMLCLSGIIGTATQDSRKFRDACEQGRLYESLQSSGMSRDEVKRRLQPYLFGKPRSMRFSNWFSAHYPTIDDYLREWKSQPLTQTERLINHFNQPHKRTAAKLQQMESKIIIETACAEIKRLKPNAVLVTVHDSILCQKVDVEIVRQQITKAFLTEGLCCSIKNG